MSQQQAQLQQNEMLTSGWRYVPNQPTESSMAINATSGQFIFSYASGQGDSRPAIGIHGQLILAPQVPYSDCDSDSDFEYEFEDEDKDGVEHATDPSVGIHGQPILASSVPHFHSDNEYGPNDHYYTSSHAPHNQSVPQIPQRRWNNPYAYENGHDTNENSNVEADLRIVSPIRRQHAHTSPPTLGPHGRSISRLESATEDIPSTALSNNLGRNDRRRELIRVSKSITPISRERLTIHLTNQIQLNNDWRDLDDEALAQAYEDMFCPRGDSSEGMGEEGEVERGSGISAQLLMSSWV